MPDAVTGIIQLANLLQKKLAPVFEKAKITPQQWFVLAALAEQDGPITLVTLARHLVVTKQNMTGMMARLEALGVVEREDDPSDLRSWRIQLTRRGRTVVDKVRPAYDEWVRSLGDLEALGRTAQRLIEELDDSRKRG
jgi:DNA-binding MarR family transcriptional regulator